MSAASSTHLQMEPRTCTYAPLFSPPPPFSPCLAGRSPRRANSSLSAPVSAALNETDPLSASDDFSVGTPTSNVIPDAAQASPQVAAPAEASKKSLTPAADAEAAKAAAQAQAAAAARAQQAAAARAAMAEGGEGMDPSEMMEARMETQQEKMEAAQEQMQERVEMIGEMLGE